MHDGIILPLQYFFFFLYHFPQYLLYIAQKIETRINELDEKEDELKKLEEVVGQKMKVLQATEREVKGKEEILNLKTKELEEKQIILEEKENVWRKLEEKVGNTKKEVEEREKKVKEDEEKAKEMMRECNVKQRRWEETEKQMEINASKVKQLVDLNVGNYSPSVIISFFIYNIYFYL